MHPKSRLGRRRLRMVGWTIAFFAPVFPAATKSIPFAATFRVDLAVIAIVWAWLVSCLVGCKRWGPAPHKSVLVLSCAFITLGLSDLALRPLLADRLYYRPHERFCSRWPRLPVVSRYQPGAAFAGRTYGDLAAMSGRPEWREPRETRFRVDRFGFRNDAPRSARPIDLVVLGDSFGVGVGIAQDKTWASLLRTRYGHRVYNLSMPGSPWQEFANLLIESGRLRLAESAEVLWAIFPGNDFDEAYLPIYRRGDLPWSGPFDDALTTVRTFRSRSPISQLCRRVVPGTTAERVIERVFVNGRTMLFYRDYARRLDRTEADLRALPNWRRFTDTAAAMAKLAAEKKLRITMVVIPSKVQVYRWVLERDAPWATPPGPGLPGSPLRRICRQYRWKYVDLTPALIRGSRRVFRESGATLYWYDDTHWNEKGHELVAGIIQRSIAKPPTVDR